MGINILICYIFPIRDFQSMIFSGFSPLLLLVSFGHWHMSFYLRFAGA